MKLEKMLAEYGKLSLFACCSELMTELVQVIGRWTQAGQANQLTRRKW